MQNKELLERFCLRQGACFYANITEAFRSNVSHYFFVLNFNPQQDHILVLTNATTGKELAESRAMKKTGSTDCIIELGDFMPNSNSVIDVSDLKAVSKKQFLESYSEIIMDNPKGNDLSENLSTKIITAIIECDNVAEELKILVDPNYQSDL